MCKLNKFLFTSPQFNPTFKHWDLFCEWLKIKQCLWCVLDGNKMRYLFMLIATCVLTQNSLFLVWKIISFSPENIKLQIFGLCLWEIVRKLLFLLKGGEGVTSFYNEIFAKCYLCARSTQQISAYLWVGGGTGGWIEIKTRVENHNFHWRLTGENRLSGWEWMDDEIFENSWQTVC